MSKLVRGFFAVLALSLALAPALRAESSWNGWITDAKCGAMGAKAEKADCTRKCAEKGEKLVLFNLGDKKIYQLDRQDLAKGQIGHPVVVKGEAKGDSIRVSAIVPAPGAASGPPPPPSR